MSPAFSQIGYSDVPRCGPFRLPFCAPFAKIASDRSHSQDRVAHASNLSTVLVPSAGAGPSARLFLRRLGACLGTTEGPRGTEERLHHNTRKLCQIFSWRSAFRPDSRRPI